MSSALKQVNKDDTPCKNDTEMMILINSEELEENDSGSDTDDNNNLNETIRTSPVKLLLIRTPWYIIGLVVLVTGVVLSQYHIHLPYEAECDDTYNDNFTNSTTTHPITNDSVNYTTLCFYILLVNFRSPAS